MARSVPVLTSNRSALPEVAGDAALLVDPSDPDSIRNGLYRLVEDAALREDLRQKGLRRAKDFSWDRTVRSIYQLYGELL
jgi:glycosyltransferase involved in cell wall biosynthesis